MSSTPVAVGRRTGGLFANMKVAQKLFAAFGVLSTLLIGVGALGIVQLQGAQQRLEGMYRDSLQATAWLGQVRTDVQEAQVVLGDMAVHTDDAHLARLTERARVLDAHIDKIWSDYTATDMTGRETQRDAFDAALARYRSVRDTQVVPLADDRTAFLAARNRDAVPLARTMNDALTRLAAIEDSAAQVSMQQARDGNDSARTIILGLIGAALLIGAVLGTVVSRSIARPLAATVVVLEGLAEGRLDQRLPVTGRDEVGRMAAALNSALDRLTGVLRNIGDNVGTLASSAEELSAVAGEMSSSAGRSATQAQAVSAASEQISVNITTVAAGAEEIGASISEIARSTSSAAEVAAHAVRASEEAGGIVHQLGDSSAQIASVVKVITSIAEQTNLLALNATIEAARAGDAGKGFAVVAGEVKELATETARATEDISRRVAAIQSDSAAAVNAIAGIGDVIQQINDTQTAIAAAVEEQTATTAEMSRTVGEVATGSRDISANVAGVAGAAADTTGAAANTAEAANELARVAGVLQQNLAMFRY